MSEDTRTREKPRDLGDLAPLRALLKEMDEQESGTRELSGDSEIAHAIASLRRKLADAIAAATQPVVDLSIREYAKVVGIKPKTAYKRFERNQIPGARREPGRGIVVPLESIAA